MTYTNGSLSVSDAFNSVQAFVTGTLLPATTGLIVLSISIALAIKAVRKFGRKLI